MQVECPSCGKTVDVPDGSAGQVVKCASCGAEMQLPPAEGGVPAGAPGAGAGTAPAGAPGETKACPYCGERVQLSAIKCRHCGEFLDAARRAESREGQQALVDYCKGMNTLGTVLYVIGGLVLVCGVGGMFMGLAASAQAAPPLLVIMLVVMAAIGAAYVILGAFAKKMHGWVNWVVLVLCSLSLLSNITTMFSSGPRAGSQTAGTFIGLIINICLVVLTISNLRKLSAVKAAGGDPRSGMGGPRSRSRR